MDNNKTSIVDNVGKCVIVEAAPHYLNNIIVNNSVDIVDNLGDNPGKVVDRYK